MTTKYLYNGELFDSLSEVSEHIQEEMNENLEPYQIGELEFYAGDILVAMDPIAFQCDVSAMVEEQEWELIADDVNGLAHQVEKAEIVLKHDFPKYYELYTEMLADYPDMDDTEKSDEIEALTDNVIQWHEGYVWRVTD